MMTFEILRHTPMAVWAALAALVGLGLSRTRPRLVSRWRLLTLPVALGVAGLASLALGFRSPWVLLVWALAFAALLVLARRLPPPSGLRWDAAAARLLLPGSWLPLAVILVLFGLRYASAVATALHPEWQHALALRLLLAGASGAVSGLLLGRAFGLLNAARQNPSA